MRRLSLLLMQLSQHFEAAWFFFTAENKNTVSSESHSREIPFTLIVWFNSWSQTKLCTPNNGHGNVMLTNNKSEVQQGSAKRLKKNPFMSSIANYACWYRHRIDVIKFHRTFNKVPVRYWNKLLLFLALLFFSQPQAYRYRYMPCSALGLTSRHTI